MFCDCYDADRKVCVGTKECDSCSCEGDKARCDFYSHVRAEGYKGEIGDKNLCPGPNYYPCETSNPMYQNEVGNVPHILDSGDRTEFSTGAVRDMREGKGRCDLMPLDVVASYTNDVILRSLDRFQQCSDVNYLYRCLDYFSKYWDDGKTKDGAEAISVQRTCTMLLEVAKHFEEGAVKYGDNNWRKGIPVRCYIDSAIRHYLKFLRGDKDEPHNRAFCWNIMCAIWTCEHHPELNDYRKGDDDASKESR